MFYQGIKTIFQILINKKKTVFYVLLRKYNGDLCTIKPKLSVVELIFVKFERKTMLLWNDIQRKNKI